MNRTRFPFLSTAIRVLPVFAGMLLATQALAQERLGTLRGLTLVEAEPHDDVINESIEVRIENGKVSVKRNGVDVPDAQVEKKDGRIIILDAHGNPVEFGDLGLGGDGSGWRFQLGGEGGMKEHVLDAMKIAEASPPKVMLGIHMTETGPALEKHLGLKAGETTMISGVFEGLAAHNAGIEQFDIIVKVDGKSPATREAVREALAGKDAGDSFALTVIHEGRQRDVTVKVDAYDKQRMGEAKLLGSAAPSPFEWQGFTGDVWEAPELHQLFVAPLGEGHAVLPPGDVRERFHTLEPQSGDLNNRLEKLDQRMAELEKMLREAIEAGRTERSGGAR